MLIEYPMFLTKNGTISIISQNIDKSVRFIEIASIAPIFLENPQNKTETFGVPSLESSSVNFVQP